MDNKKYKEKVEIQEKIRRVNGAMAQEGMPLTKDIKKILSLKYFFLIEKKILIINITIKPSPS